MKQRKGIRAAALAVALLLTALVLAACGEDLVGAGQDGGLIGAQASGKFSSGTIFSGSVNGTFTVVGLGNVSKNPYTVEMEVRGLLWFVCVNNGGNEAPGQFDFVLGDEEEPVLIEDPSGSKGADKNGKYLAELTVDPTNVPDENCDRNNNWRVKTYDDGVPVTYVQPKYVTAFLRQEDGTVTDTLEWDCSDVPNPTYPLENYVMPGDFEDYCSVVVGV